MYRLYLVRLIIILLILVSFSALPVYSQPTAQSTKWGFGITGNYFLPIFNLNERFAGGLQYGFKWSYCKNSTTYDIQYIYSKFSSGKIEEATFQWVYDGNQYTSPDASSEIHCSGVMGNLQQPIKFGFGNFLPYWNIGAGFIYYEHQIKDLVFPGQSIPPIDYTFTYSPDKESNTALSINFGGGLHYPLTRQFDLALDLKYYILISYLRPMEAWLLEKVSPIQLFAVGLDLTYYFGK
ncbi:outer membrane beta-barrel protein [candidate division KSB1 bacterium]|nr:outer membrane beta-barrel protein [candidate division KSB1 bacterium]